MGFVARLLHHKSEFKSPVTSPCFVLLVYWGVLLALMVYELVRHDLTRVRRGMINKVGVPC